MSWRQKMGEIWKGAGCLLEILMSCNIVNERGGNEAFIKPYNNMVVKNLEQSFHFDGIGNKSSIKSMNIHLYLQGKI